VIVNVQESDQSDDNEHDRANANQHAIHSSKKAKYAFVKCEKGKVVAFQFPVGVWCRGPKTFDML
jgi:hypothetical protein